MQSKRSLTLKINCIGWWKFGLNAVDTKNNLRVLDSKVNMSKSCDLPNIKTNKQNPHNPKQNPTYQNKQNPSIFLGQTKRNSLSRPRA